MKPVEAETKLPGHTSQNAGDEGQMRRGLLVFLEGEIHTSGDTSATSWGHQSNLCVLLSNVEGSK